MIGPRERIASLEVVRSRSLASSASTQLADNLIPHTFLSAIFSFREMNGDERQSVRMLFPCSLIHDNNVALA